MLNTKALFLSLAALPCSSSVVQAFAPVVPSVGRHSLVVLQSEAGPQSIPLQFEDDLLGDMQSVLVTLEKRVKEGPGSLTLLEVEEMDTQFQRILVEMKMNEHKEIILPEAAKPTVPQINVPSPTEIASFPSMEKPITDKSMDEGPAYEGKGGMGQPQGTVNTYVIEGMDEMSPEEYQQKLQQSVIDRQAKRRASGVVGNRSTWDYLNNLTGETGVLKDTKSKEEKKDDDKKDFNPFQKY